MTNSHLLNIIEHGEIEKSITNSIAHPKPKDKEVDAVRHKKRPAQRRKAGPEKTKSIRPGPASTDDYSRKAERLIREIEDFVSDESRDHTSQ